MSFRFYFLVFFHFVVFMFLNLRNKRLFSCCRSSILGFSKRIFRFRFRTLRLSLSPSLARQRNVLCCCCCYAPTLCSSAARSLLCFLSPSLFLQLKYRYNCKAKRILMTRDLREKLLHACNCLAATTTAAKTAKKARTTRASTG